MYSLALRLRRICCTEDLFEKRAEEQKQKLLERGYRETIIAAGIQRARDVPRAEALKKVDKESEEEECRQHRLIVEFDRRSSPALGEILRNNHEAACSRDSRFRQLFPKAPKPVFRRGKNLKQILCKAKLPKIKALNTRAADRGSHNGVTRCNKGSGRSQCKACPYLTERPNQVIKELKVHSSGETIKIEDQINCKTKSVLYAAESVKDPKQYAGQTGGTVARRTLQHANDIGNQRLEKAVPEHFRETKSRKEHLRMTPFKVIKSKDPYVRLHFEREFISKHNFVEAGINKNL